MAKHWKLAITAPNDGREVMFRRKPPFSASGNILIGFWHDGQDKPGWVQQGTGLKIDLNVWTHWQDMPEL